MLRRCTIFGIWVGLLGLLGLLAWGVFRVSAADSVNAGVGGPTRVNWDGRALPLRPRPAPDFRLELFSTTSGEDALKGASGAELRLAALRGAPVVVNFWASWCLPCKQEAPVLDRFAREYGPRGVAFVGVNVWDNDANARAFLEEYGLTYTNGVDTAGGTAIDYGLTGLPETFFVDRDGQLVRKFIGPVTERALRAAVEELLS